MDAVLFLPTLGWEGYAIYQAYHAYHFPDGHGHLKPIKGIKLLQQATIIQI